MKYGNLKLGQVEAIINKLGGMTGVELFLSGEIIVGLPQRQLGTWRTIKVGDKFVDIAIVTPRHLGYTGGVEMEEFCTAASQKGLVLMTKEMIQIVEAQVPDSPALNGSDGCGIRVGMGPSPKGSNEFGLGRGILYLHHGEKGPLYPMFVGVDGQVMFVVLPEAEK